jgi:hypothetical protein
LDLRAVGSTWFSRSLEGAVESEIKTTLADINGLWEEKMRTVYRQKHAQNPFGKGELGVEILEEGLRRAGVSGFGCG